MISTGLRKSAAGLAMPSAAKAGALPKPPPQSSVKKFEPPKARVTASRRPGNPVPGLRSLTGASEMSSYGKPIQRKMLQRIRRF